jgi:hypothetical protein
MSFRKKVSIRAGDQPLIGDIGRLSQAQAMLTQAGGSYVKAENKCQ